jgi:hypothetical protein
MLSSESGLQTEVNSGYDCESQMAMPNQNAGCSWKFHVPPEPSASGNMGGSFGSRILQILLLPEPFRSE